MKEILCAPRGGYFQRFTFNDEIEHQNSPTLGVNSDSSECKLLYGTMVGGR